MIKFTARASFLCQTIFESLTVLLLAICLVFTFFPDSAQALEFDCEIPNSVVCKVSDPDGFTEVRVNVDFDELGSIDVAKQNFPTCQTETTVSWDPIVPNFQILATPCKVGNELTFKGSSDTYKKADRVESKQIVQGFEGKVIEDKLSIIERYKKYKRAKIKDLSKAEKFDVSEK